MSKQCLLSLSLIMRDAAEDILTCLESVAAAVDEMVIVDTGSQDDSVKIVRKFLRKWQGENSQRRGKVYTIEWRDDFSWAKNYALTKCHGDFVLLLDSDESISPATQGHLRPLVEALAHGKLPKGVERVLMPGQQAEAEKPGESPLDLLEFQLENVDREGHPVETSTMKYGNVAVRLCRRHEKLRYFGEVHEQLLFSDGRPARLALAAREYIEILHGGYRPGLAEKKEQRNYEILLKEKERGGTTYLLDYYLAAAHLCRSHWEQALTSARDALAAARPAHDQAAPYRIMYQAASAMEKEALEKAGLQLAEGEKLPEGTAETEDLKYALSLRQESEKILAAALEEYPDYPEFYYFRGGRRWNSGDEAGGRADLEKAWQLAEDFSARHPEDAFRFQELMPSLKAALEQIK